MYIMLKFSGVRVQDRVHHRAGDHGAAGARRGRHRRLLLAHGVQASRLHDTSWVN